MLLVLHKRKDDDALRAGGGGWRCRAGGLLSRHGPLLCQILYLLEQNHRRDNCIVDEKVQVLWAG